MLINILTNYLCFFRKWQVNVKVVHRDHLNQLQRKARKRINNRKVIFFLASRKNKFRQVWTCLENSSNLKISIHTGQEIKNTITKTSWESLNCQGSTPVFILFAGLCGIWTFLWHLNWYVCSRIIKNMILVTQIF